MSRGKRYNGEQKLNIKKVIATILFFIIILLIIVFLVKQTNASKAGNKKVQEKNISNSYLTVFTNSKWGVINSKGEIVITPTYDNFIVIPDATKPVFICQKDVDLDNKTFNSYAINNKSEKLYSNYEEVEPIQNIYSNGTIYYEKDLLIVKNNGKYGLINLNGDELLECTYDSIEPIKNIKNSYKIVKDGKVGLSDNSGNIIIDPEYKDIEALTDKYENGYIVQDNNNKYGLINYNKKQVLECKYDKIFNVYGNNMYVVTENGKTKLINQDGETILSTGFDEIEEIDTNILIKKNDKYGVIETSGNTLIEPTYNELKYIFDGKYIAENDDGNFGIIDINNNEVVPFLYTRITYLSEEGIIEADEKNGQTVLMNTSFENKAEGIVSEINENYNFIKVRVNGEYKYYNFKLEEKNIKDIYPANTLFLSKQNGKYGYVDKNGTVIVDYIYDDATEQNEFGFSAVKKDGKWGAIDSTGKVVIEPSYTLSQNTIINFIGKWHLGPDINANYYTDIKE